MKSKIVLMTSLCSAALLTGCCGMYSEGGCGYYDYPSQCGLPSCTDNTTIMEYSNPCPGPYNCSVNDSMP